MGAPAHPGHCIPASLVSHLLGRILWGSAALGEQPAPPHAAPSMPAAGGGRCGPGLLVCLPACSRTPCHHWPGCRLAIYSRGLRPQPAALVGVANVAPIRPPCCASLASVTKCYDLPSPHNTAHTETLQPCILRVRLVHASAVLTRQPRSRGRARPRHPLPQSPDTSP